MEIVISTCTPEEAPVVMQLIRRLWAYNDDPGIGIDDVAQEALLGVFDARDSYDEDRGRYLPFLYRVVKNRLINLLRRTENRLGDEACEPGMTVLAIDTWESGRLRERVQHSNQMLVTCHWELATKVLSYRDRQIMWCVERGDDISEVADQFDLSRTAINFALTRARRKMRKALKCH